MTEEYVYGPDDRPELAVSTVRFTIRAEHDLLADKPLFGLVRAAEPELVGPFPGISPVPLYVGQARQSAMATFKAEGFEAAAVTAIAMAPGGAAPPPVLKRVLRFTVDRAFGCLAVHRATGLVLFAARITDPDTEETSF